MPGPPSGLRAAAPLSLTGRYAPGGRSAAAGLEAFARHTGVELGIDDDRSDPVRAARIARERSGVEILFGPYGSGATRAVDEALAGSPAVVWNHGGSEVGRRRSRLIDIPAPATAYWRDLAPALSAAGIPPGAVALLAGRSPFGRAVAAGARASLAAAGARPLRDADLTEAGAAAAVADALSAGARAVVACGRMEEDLAAGRTLAGSGVLGALVVCGVGSAGDELGAAVAGWLGPAQWWPGAAPPPVPLGDDDYPAAQALASGLIALAAIEAAGSTDPDRVHRAALALRTATFFGPFAVDTEGRQIAHAPTIVRWSCRGGGLVRERAPLAGARA